MVPSEYLVNYGRAAFLGRFANDAGVALGHGDRVVVRSPRGLETGTVLGAVASTFARLVGAGPSGDLLRRATDDDERREAELRRTAEDMLAEGQAIADRVGLPVSLVDVEILLDGRRAVVHGLPWADCDATPLCESLSARHDAAVTFLDLRTPAAAEAEGCGKPGCGSGGGGCDSCGTGGGCSTGGCSSGKVKSADELTAYFAGLRKQMDATFGRVPLND